jgi:hypothetical protein
MKIYVTDHNKHCCLFRNAPPVLLGHNKEIKRIKKIYTLDCHLYLLLQRGLHQLEGRGVPAKIKGDLFSVKNLALSYLENSDHSC